MSLNLDVDRTALVLIDLQKGILALPTAPRTSPEVLANATKLLTQFRQQRGLVVLVRVSPSPDLKDRLKQPADAPMPAHVPPPDWSNFPPELELRDGDLIITKRQWGAFYGTELDLQLRRRGIRTIILAGIATNFGVESTARDAWERGYELVLVEDAMASVNADAHHFAASFLFPKIGLVRSTEQVSSALELVTQRT
jgi:nicotinamidase-related amidase